MRANGFEVRDTTAQELAAAKIRTGLKMPDACVIAAARAGAVEAVLSLDQRVARAARAEGFSA
ncbi:MAG: hypothetical protein LBG60_02185 [Bifidobacteriaceae bacterium]|jgi:predicted nucleic acid-binding protein|nr:hypothetical protein [Bifidobacteriaceae bacterium]